MRLHAALSTLLIASSSWAGSWPDLTAGNQPQGGGELDTAVVVGIQDYLFVPKIPGATRNADDWYLYLTRTRKIPLSRVRLLRNSEATKEAIAAEAQWAAGQARKGGLVWFVFIGHGAPAADGKDGVLVGADAQQRADSLYARSLEQQALLRELQKGKQERTLLVLDACFSGRGSEGGELVRGLQPLIAVKAASPTGKVTLLSAGTPDQFAGPLPGEDRPAFSYLLLGALRGWGDEDGNGEVTAREAVDYAGGALTALVKDRRQTPQLSGSDPGVLARKAQEKGPDLVAMVVSGGGKSPSEQRQVGEPPKPEPVELGDESGSTPPPLSDIPPVDFNRPRAGEAETTAQKRRDCAAGKGDECVNLGLNHDVGRPEEDFLYAAAAYDRACTLSSGVGCLDLALLYQHGRGLPQDPVRARAYYERSCALDYPRGCNDAGWFVREGRGGPVDDRKALAMFRKSCDAKYADGCINLGWMYENGRGLAADPSIGARWYQRACEMSAGQGCGNLGILYANGKGVPKDEARALALYRRGCDLKWARACNDAGAILAARQAGMAEDGRALALYRQSCEGNHADGCINYGWMHEHGRGVAANGAVALEHYRKGCELGSGLGCRNAGWMYQHGKGTTLDLAQAERLHLRSCELGHMAGCNSAGWLIIGKPGEAERAVGLYRKACDGGDTDGCVNLGHSYQNGKGVNASDALAVQWYRHACDKGSGLGCSNHGWMAENGRGMEPDAAVAFASFKKSCGLQNGDGCNNLGRSLQAGKGTLQDYGAARIAYEQACSAGSSFGCSNLATLLEGEWGGPPDKVRASSLFKKACAMGKTDVCGK